DSYRFQKAGADPVILFSASGVFTYMVSENRVSSVDEIEKKINTAVDVIILEGFSETVKKDNRVAKIICYSSREQLQEYFNNITPPILGYYSYKDIDSIDFNELMKRIDDYIVGFKTIYNFYNLLPKIDCLKCGYNNCFEMARKIYEGENDLSDCPVISAEFSNIEVTVNGTRLSLKPFPAKIIRNTVIALISSLKQVDEKLEGKITININKN
ncbi:MAG: molybdopterin-guanine dinucleotide biosynthesis protein MobB, partial [Candidatus Odinarchaeota archaeon]